MRAWLDVGRIGASKCFSLPSWAKSGFPRMPPLRTQLSFFSELTQAAMSPHPYTHTPHAIHTTHRSPWLALSPKFASCPLPACGRSRKGLISHKIRISYLSNLILSKSKRGLGSLRAQSVHGGRRRGGGASPGDGESKQSADAPRGHLVLSSKKRTPTRRLSGRCDKVGAKQRTITRRKHFPGCTIRYTARHPRAPYGWIVHFSDCV